MATRLGPWHAAIPLMLVAMALWVAWTRGRSSGGERRAANPPQSVAGSLVGTPSCSARGCHGSIESAGDPLRCQQNEYTAWMNDKHADAFRVLFSERSRNMVRLLGDGKAAHEDPRCLACHANPALATLPVDSPFAREELLFGVGCESCHGKAGSWLIGHTTADWRTKKPTSAMPDLSDPAMAAKACVGCHVGAAPRDGLPLRDVNHDMLAAGHPRLTFEFGTYVTNMPAHWRPKPKPNERAWAVGQIASSSAALELLAHRADAGPWPEFAEYDCFACHHSLVSPSSRQSGARKPGGLAWGSWYFALTDVVAGESGDLTALRATMQKARPERKQVVHQAQAALDALKKAQARKKARVNLDVLRRVQAEPSWDAAEQAYLALHALNDAAPDPSIAKLLGELTPLRAFPPGLDGPAPTFDPARFFERLRSGK